MRLRAARTLGLASGLAALVGAAQEGVRPGAPSFEEGDVITLDEVEQLKPFLPPEFWANREFFFYEGMQLEIGPAFRDYSEPPRWKEVTQKFEGQSKIGPENSLEGYTAGQPFVTEQLDCKGDPKAGAKIAWNMDQRWEGDGTRARYTYSYWDRGEKLPLYFEGTWASIQRSHRIEPKYLDAQGGDLFRGEKRKSTFGIEVDAPFDARGIAIVTHRYKDSEKPEAQAKNDDTWVYVPTLRRVRRISSAQRTHAVGGTDFTFDDLRSFSGIVPQYEWQCLGEMDLLAPMNTKVKAYPYSRDHDFGPYGLSYADDRWELRKAVKIRFVPRNPDHPYLHKDLYLDRQTFEPLYSFAYDRNEELWKIIWHNHRWSEDDKEWYHGWEGIPEPRDLRVVSDTIVNVQTGTGNRIEFWDSDGMPLPRGKRFDGRLTKGR